MVVLPRVPITLALIEADQFSGRVVDHVLLEQVSLAALVDEHAVVRGALGQPAAVDVVTGPLEEPDEPFEAARLRVERGEDGPTPTIDYNVF